MLTTATERRLDIREPATFHQARTLHDALRLRAEVPGALPIAGGTDIMVKVNSGRWDPPALIDIGRLDPLRVLSREGERMRIGAGVTFARLLDDGVAELAALTMAARTVGSRQIRQRATLGGNLATASPAGDGHPALLVNDALVELRSVRASRLVPISEFFLGPGVTVVQPDELVTALILEPRRGPQVFSKVGRRSAMAIAMCSLALAIDVVRNTVRVAIGSAAPVARRAVEAEQFLASELFGGKASSGAVPAPVAEQFAGLVVQAAAPIDDIRATAGYRCHALAVLAKRATAWIWEEIRCA